MSTATGSQIKLLLLTAGNVTHPSTRTRATQYISDFKNRGIRVTWVPRVPDNSENLLNWFLFPFLKRWFYLKTRAMILFYGWDVLFIQRAYLEKSLLKYLKSKNIPIVYDFDDALYLHKEDRSAGGSLCGQMIEFSSTVIVSTPYLTPFCLEHGKTPVVIPTSVDGSSIQARIDYSINKVPVIGWIGSSTTTITIYEAEEGLRRLAKKCSFRFVMMGANLEYQPEGVPFEHIEWSLQGEKDFLKIIDIGIMPLPLTKYSEGKGGYKLFLYMAAGIPSIATPIGINAGVILDGENGFHASTDEDWEVFLLKLIENEDLRKKLGTKSREIFDRNYSTSIALNAILEIINKLVKNDNSGNLK